MNSTRCLNEALRTLNLGKKLSGSGTSESFLVDLIIFGISSTSTSNTLPHFNGPLRSGHGPIVFRGGPRIRLPLSHGPVVHPQFFGFTSPRLHYGLNRSPMVDRPLNRFTPQKPRLGLAAETLRLGPVRQGVWVHTSSTSVWWSSLMTCDAALLVRSLNSTTCLNVTSRTLNLSKSEFLVYLIISWSSFF